MNFLDVRCTKFCVAIRRGDHNVGAKRMPLLDWLEFWGRTYEIRLEQSCKSSRVGRNVSVERVADRVFGWLCSGFSIYIGH